MELDQEKDYLAWLDAIFLEVARQLGVPAEPSGSSRTIGAYIVSNTGPKSDMGNVQWEVTIKKHPLRPHAIVGTFDWRTFTPQKIADAITQTISALERSN